MCDAFIAGMTLVPIHQRLLENREFIFQHPHKQARAQEMAYRKAETFRADATSNNTFLKETSLNDGDVNPNTLEAFSPLKACYFCEKPSHSQYT